MEERKWYKVETTRSTSSLIDAPVKSLACVPANSAAQAMKKECDEWKSCGCKVYGQKVKLDDGNYNEF